MGDSAWGPILVHRSGDSRGMKVRGSGVTLAVGFAMLGCQSGGVGDPCVPEDEYQQYFSGYEVGEVDTETRSFQCETRVCLINHFQGRVSCPYGQSLAGGAQPRCHMPGSTDPASAIQVDVRPQFLNRRAVDAVYCSCRCAGPDAEGRYCKCPDGFACTEILPDIKVGPHELTGSYCIKKGTEYDSRDFLPTGSCSLGERNCGNEDGT
jgi:hypothetical protein